MSVKKDLIAIRLKPMDLKKLKAIAKRKQETVSEVIRRAIEKYLEMNK